MLYRVRVLVIGMWAMLAPALASPIALKASSQLAATSLPSLRIHGRSSLRTWFFSVVRRTAWEQRRRLWVREFLLARWSRQTALEPAREPDEALRSSEESHALRQALAALPTRQREVLHLVFYQELTIEEAAKVLRWFSFGYKRE